MASELPEMDLLPSSPGDHVEKGNYLVTINNNLLINDRKPKQPKNKNFNFSSII